MLWFTIWLVLVLATVVGAFFLGRRLWRSGKALAAELGRAAEVTARLEELQAGLAERFPAPVPPRAAIGADAQEREGFRAVHAAHRENVQRRRVARLDRALRHWRTIVAPR